jgi:hypothetical protein
VSAPAADSGERLERARAALHRATQTLGDHQQVRRRGESVPGAGVLPVAPALARLFPEGGVRRGSTVRVPSAMSLVMALLAEPSARGIWSAVVGLPDFGLVAAAEAGIDLTKLALIPEPGTEIIQVVSALLDGVDLIVLGDTRRLRAGDRQRLAAKARQKGAVLVATTHWHGADLDLEVAAGPGSWRGIAGDGHGRLYSRRVQIRATGRGGMAYRGRKASVLLPGPDGAVATLELAETSSRGGGVAAPRARQAG